jgi:exo-1,4-beta-D-glucosaminidase
MKRLSVLYILFLTLILFSCKKNNKIVFDKLLSNNWKVISSDNVAANDSLIAIDMDTAKTLTARVPATIMSVLLQNGYYKNIFYGENLKKIDTSKFFSAWWYKKSFEIKDTNKIYRLKFDGLNYYAQIWLNGVKIADTNEIKNPYRQYTLFVNKYIKIGKNILAIKIYPPHRGDFNIGFVDWNPMAPDKEMGIVRPVHLLITNKIALENPSVSYTFLNKKLDKVILEPNLRIKNYTNDTITGNLIVCIDSLRFRKTIRLRAKEEKNVRFSFSEYKNLLLNNPKLWWTYTVGKAHLYKVRFKFLIGNKEADEKTFDLGIRQVQSYFTKKGDRGFVINGNKILIKGGGWVDNLFLNNTKENILRQLEYVKQMGLNTIRLEGFWGNSQLLYHLCDSMGIMVMVGWSCNWEWKEYLGKYCDSLYGGILSDKDIDLMTKAWKDQIIWLRNHTSIIAWFSGSDKIPHPKAEKKYLKILDKYDNSPRVYLASAQWLQSLAGATGVKMRGPYEVVSPVYWYEDSLNGGAYGFNTETGPGAQVPPIESIKKMIPTEDLWPIDSVWEYHCGRNEFQTLNRYNNFLYKRYGKMRTVQEYSYKAQAMNYELMRAMFEAFSARRYKSTGIIQWMLNSAWPEMFWQLYDYYLMPNGAFFGALKANKPLHIIYDYKQKSLYIVNDRLKTFMKLKIDIKVYDINSDLIYTKKLYADAKANSSQKIIDLPDFKQNTVYFLSIVTTKNADTLDNNFYWLSAKPDVMDYQKTNWFVTPQKKFADYTGLNKLPKGDIAVSYRKIMKANKTDFVVSLKNKTNKIQFFIQVLIEDKKTLNVILPVLWTDNYISLLPNEKREIRGSIPNKALIGKNAVIKIESWSDFNN